VSFVFVLTEAAESDLDDILIWSHLHFGAAVRDGYEALIMAGISDVV